MPAQPATLRHLPAVFWGLLAATAAVRMIGIARPLLGPFATKNVVYAMIARNWARGDAPIWLPTLDLLRGGGGGLHLVEYPVSACLTAGLWRLFGGSLDVWGRATAVAFSTASVALMFVYVRRRHGPQAATAAAIVLAFAPVSIIYGQSFMLEASVVFFTLAVLYALDRWLEPGRGGWLVVATFCLALLLLTKIYMLVILLPAAWAVWCSQRKRRGLALAAVAVALLPAAVWYGYVLSEASAGGSLSPRVYYSVVQSMEAHRSPHLLLGSADFYCQVLDDLSGVALTPIGLALLLAGLLYRRWWQYAPWLAAMVLLVAALPRKFHEANYYYLVVLPPLAVMVGLGWDVLRERVRPGRLTVVVVVAVALLFAARYSVKPAFVTPPEDRAVVAAARAVRQLTAEDEPVVTIHGTAPDLLYYCDRPGWALDATTPKLADALESCRRQGARYVVVVGDVSIRAELVTKGDGFRVYRLAGTRRRARRTYRKWGQTDVSH
ncbi:MAG: glycosyltransferase family 39 protein [Candidatus Nealsonbacteria bacterium]|nr:glycosyltransferase family 39 protein [Candidatus Nealsonbacteria bacterium]